MSKLLDFPAIERMTPTDASGPHDGEKRRQILAGAREVFLAKGYEGASMDAIAKAAAVSKGTLYVYFASKDVLFEALIIEEKRSLAENLINFDAGGLAFDAYLRRIAVNLCERFCNPDHLASIRMVLGAVEKFPAFGGVFYNAGPQRGVSRMAEVLAKAMAEGHLRAADPDVAARHFISLCTSDLLKRALFAVDPRPSPDTILASVEEGLTVFLAAYGPR